MIVLSTLAELKKKKESGASPTRPYFPGRADFPEDVQAVVPEPRNTRSWAARRTDRNTATRHRRPAPSPVGKKAYFGSRPFPLAASNPFPLCQFRKGTLSKSLSNWSVGAISSTPSGMVNMAAAVRCLGRGKAMNCRGLRGKDVWRRVSCCRRNLLGTGLHWGPPALSGL